jgi:hypothetical protein
MHFFVTHHPQCQLSFNTQAAFDIDSPVNINSDTAFDIPVSFNIDTPVDIDSPVILDIRATFYINTSSTLIKPLALPSASKWLLIFNMSSRVGQKLREI